MFKKKVGILGERKGKKRGRNNTATIHSTVFINKFKLQMKNLKETVKCCYSIFGGHWWS